MCCCLQGMGGHLRCPDHWASEHRGPQGRDQRSSRSWSIRSGTLSILAFSHLGSPSRARVTALGLRGSRDSSNRGRRIDPDLRLGSRRPDRPGRARRNAVVFRGVSCFYRRDDYKAVSLSAAGSLDHGWRVSGAASRVSRWPQLPNRLVARHGSHSNSHSQQPGLRPCSTTPNGPSRGKGCDRFSDANDGTPGRQMFTQKGQA